jgi:hypothetical protein
VSLLLLLQYLRKISSELRKVNYISDNIMSYNFKVKPINVNPLRVEVLTVYYCEENLNTCPLRM